MLRNGCTKTELCRGLAGRTGVNIIYLIRRHVEVQKGLGSAGVSLLTFLPELRQDLLEGTNQVIFVDFALTKDKRQAVGLIR